MGCLCLILFNRMQDSRLRFLKRGENQLSSRNKKQMEASEAFYNSDPKPGSLASKAKMVQKYNDKHAKK